MARCYLFLLYVLTTALFLCASPAIGQVPSNPLGLNPFGLKWQQIKTERVEIIFPEELQPQAQRVANVVHYLWDNQRKSVGDKAEKVTILLQNQTTNANGFVTVGPYRSEFYVTPPQFNISGAADWLDLLAIHEYRHVQQFSNSSRGVTKFFRTILGSWVWGGFLGTALPRWYLEGDAVGTETALTLGGRGRVPEFDMEYRALRLSGRKYGYEKASATSLKQFVPNHYNLGYYMTTYARVHFGADIWSRVVQDAVNFKGVFFPFSQGLHRYTGLRTRQLYRATMQELDSLWIRQDTTLQLTNATVINQKKKATFTSYRNAQYEAAGVWLVEKSGFDKIRTLVRVYANGTEETLTLPGINDEVNNTLSVVGSQVCWSELAYGVRWGLQDFSVVCLYDIKTKQKRRITQQTRYFAPALSPDGQKIAAVEVNTDLSSALVILDAATGTLLQKFSNPGKYLLSFPKWTLDGQHVICVAQQSEENWLMWWDAATGEAKEISQRTHYQLTNPCPAGEFVLVSAAFTGINNIFALKIATGDFYQATSVRLGAFQPALSPKGDKFCFSSYSADGYDLAEANFEPALWPKYLLSKPSELNYFATLAEQEGGSIVKKVGNETFEVQRFKKWKGLINPHSLLPYVFPPEFGVSLLSDNKFSTLSAQIGAIYNNNEGTMSYNAGVKYAELFPVLETGFNRSQRSRTNFNFGALNDTTLALTYYNAQWIENDLYASVSLPLNFTRGANFTRLLFSATYRNIQLDVTSQLSDPANFVSRFRTNNVNAFAPFFTQQTLRSGVIQALDFELNFSRLRAIATQHIYPRWGITMNLRYRTTISTGVNQGNVFLGQSNVYLPSIFRNHGFVLSLAYQRELFTDQYKFRNLFFYPRGYASFIGDEVSKFGISYYLPLWCPDLALGSLLFLKRIKAECFYDSATILLNSWRPFNPTNNTIRSAGVELTFDLRLLRLLEVDMGFRYSYLLDAFSSQNPHVFQLLLLRIGI